MSFHFSLSPYSAARHAQNENKNSSLPNSSSSSSLPHSLPILHSQIRFHIFTSSFSQQRLTTKNPKSFNPLKLSSVLHLRRTRRRLRRVSQRRRAFPARTNGDLREVRFSSSSQLLFPAFLQIPSSFPLWYLTLSFHFGSLRFVFPFLRSSSFFSGEPRQFRRSSNGDRFIVQSASFFRRETGGNLLSFIYKPISKFR